MNWLTEDSDEWNPNMFEFDFYSRFYFRREVRSKFGFWKLFCRDWKVRYFDEKV